MTDFVHLHVHSEYSLLDGACRVGELAKAAAEMGQRAIAVTDHGNLFAAVAFYDACLKAGIKPIIGCEVYVADGSRFDKRNSDKPFHLTLLCKNNIGWKNLSKLVSMSYSEGFYRKPRIDFSLLEKYHEGLICLSGCIAGEVSRKLLDSDLDGASKTALRYRGLFGEDYFLEVMIHDTPEQKSVFNKLVRLSRETSIPLCATNDVHYIRREDSYAQRILMCINIGKTLEDDDRLELPSEDFYLRSGDEMAALFRSCPEAVENTVRIADKCNVTFTFGEIKLPFYKLEGGGDHFRYLWQLTFDGLKKRYETPSDEAVRRAEYELSVIRDMGYVDYFLIVWDFVHYAKTHDVPVGCGRGSGAGSLVAYCIGITDIDPLRYGLIFERFLNPARTSMPDFDIDFCTEKRQKVIDYVISRYGADHVSQIVTFGTLGAKQALRDCARTMGMSYKAGDVAARIVQRGSTLAESLKNSDELKKLYNGDLQYRRLIDTAMRIENMPRNTSTHAAGVVITKDPVDEYVPLYVRDGQTATQFTMKVLERLGLLKMDFLGLSNLTVIDGCIKAIKRIEPDFDIDKIPLDDRAVFEMLSRGRTQGVFQFESSGMTSTIMQLRPDCIEDLIAVLALYRPGPMSSIPTYIRNRHDPSKVVYAHPMLESILKETYGCIVYQEQVMEIFRRLAGYSMGRADLLRRAISKKHTEDIEKERESFLHGDGEVCGTAANGIPEQTAMKIFDDIVAFGDYAFNKSHAAAYATISYRTAYLKAHYPGQYLAALLTVTQYEKPYKLMDYITEVTNASLKMFPLDVNKSTSVFTAEQQGIRFSLCSVKGIGEGLINALVEEREDNGDYTSLYDLCVRTSKFGVTARNIEVLIKCGALDCFGYNRHELLMAYENVLKQAQYSARDRMEGQLDLFGGMSEKDSGPTIKRMPEFDRRNLLEMEYEVSGMYLSGHPLDEFLPYAECAGCRTAGEFADENDTSDLKNDQPAEMLMRVTSAKPYRAKNGAMMCFAEGEDKTGTCEFIVFSSLYETAKSFLKEGNALHLVGRVTVKDDEPKKLIADLVETADRFVQECSRRDLCVRVDPRDGEVLSRVKAAAEKYGSAGGVRLGIFLSDRRQLISIKTARRVRLCPELICELQKAAGRKNVQFMKQRRGQ